MSSLPPNENRGPLDHLALRYLRQALNSSHPNDEPYVLNAMESRVIRRVKVQTLTLAALIGLLGVAFMYFPQYNWPNLFIKLPITLRGVTYNVPVTAILYGALLVYLEVNLLIAINVRATRHIMAVCQFPRAHDARYDRHLQALAHAANRRTGKVIPRFGLDPYLNLPRWGLAVYFLLNILKAALNTFAVRLLARRLLGGVAFRQVTDMAGMPIYAFWNAYASWQVVKEAQVRVMAPMTIREFVSELHDELGKNEQFRSLILEALQYITISKRQYNYAHYLFTETLLDRFNLRTSTPSTGRFTDYLAQATPEVRRGLERLLIFGALVDGRLSWLERRRLTQLRKKGFITHSSADIVKLGAEYNQGRGLWV